MKTIRLVIVAVLMAASGGALHVLRAEQAVKQPANVNREEQSNMTNEKVIMLIEAKIQPHELTACRRVDYIDSRVSSL